MKFILACSANHIIGIDGKLPWKIREEYQYFIDKTHGSSIVCGRKTAECFSSFENWRNVYILSHLHPIDMNRFDDSVWCVGGSSLYNRIAELQPSEVYLTYIDQTYEVTPDQSVAKLSPEFWEEISNHYTKVKEDRRWLLDKNSMCQVQCSFDVYKLST